ncbi:Gfo/Idh/MocA family protein [Arvimicrobium flavum]|uniref:Gfo/Idh/MocA family protein n=1 Tax=Arvimicrobium flavum TaxID=3393320 RepID=UPI00237B74CE|nr:Gfo/Idh/MocA family oxidoreductase [Mesorhizobium shangrilense]
MQDTDIRTLQPQSTRPFTWGIVGAGVIARQFAADLGSIAGMRVGAVCSRSEASAVRLMRATGATRFHQELAALLTDTTIDGVYIATPNSLHAPQALQTLAAGKPVLVEKPLATSAADAARIAEMAKASGCFAMEALWTRFLPAVAAVRDMISTGTIGEIERIEAELAYRKQESADGRFFDPALGGGSALDLGVYPLSLALHLLGLPDRHSGRWWPAKSGVDLRCEFKLAFGQAKAALSCGFDRNGHNSFTILGSRGAIRLEQPFLKAQRVTVFGKSVRDLPLVGARTPVSGIAAKLLARLPLPGRKAESYRFAVNGLQFEAAAVMEAVRRGARQSDVMPLDHSVAVLEIIDAVLGRPPERG